MFNVLAKSFNEKLPIDDFINKRLLELFELPENEDNIYFVKMGCKIVPTYVDRRGVNPKKDLKLIKEYYKMMKEIKPDVVLS